MAILYDICCFVFAAIQALAAIFTIRDRNKWKSTATPNPASSVLPNTEFHILMAALLIIGAVGAGILGGYLVRNPTKPQIVTVTVEKPVQVPCPATKTGSAMTRGAQSPAITGSGNPITYGAPLPKDEKAPK